MASGFRLLPSADPWQVRLQPSLTRFGARRNFRSPPSMKRAAPKAPGARYGLTPVVFVCVGTWMTIALTVLLGWIVLRAFNWLFSG